MLTKLTRQGDLYLLTIDRQTVERSGIDVDASLSVMAE